MGLRRQHIALPLVLTVCGADLALAQTTGGADAGLVTGPDGGSFPDGGGGPTDGGLATGPGEPGGRPMRVGYTGSAPFVVERAGGAPTGFSIAVWEALAEDLEFQIRYQPFETVASLLEAVEHGMVDVGVGPISVTARRAEAVEFTQPYFSARVGILSPSGSGWDRLRPFFNRAFLVGVLTLVFVLLCVGTLVWLLERRRNSAHFPVPPAKGIPEGMWFALVTLTTVGYGDRTPVTGAGRVVTGIWMVFAMVAASSITAGIATALTLSQIETGGITSLKDIAQRRVAVVRGTPAQGLVAARGARPLVVATLEEGVDAVARTWADAMLYDLPVLDHYAQTHPALDLQAHPTSQRTDDYAFAVAVGSPLRRVLSRGVLVLRERRQVKTIAEEWSVQP